MKINEQAREELLAEVYGISDRELNKKPAAEKWSIKQILEHLYLIENAFTKMIQEQLDTGDVVNAKEKPIELTVNRSEKVEAPAFSVPSEEYASMVELKGKLATSHEGLLSIARNADDQELKEKGLKHSAFGRISLSQAVSFVGYHEIRHTEQLKEVKEALGIST